MTVMTWRRCVWAGCLLGALYVAVPGRLAHDLIWLVVLAGTSWAVAVGIRRNRPRTSKPWWALFGGCLALLAGNVLRLPVWDNRLQYVAAAGATLLAYSAIGLASLGLARAQAPGRDREGAIDGAIVMIGLTTLLSGTFLAPAVVDQMSTAVEGALLLVPPLVVAAIISVTLRLLFGGSSRVPSAWLLVAASVVGLLGSIVRIMLSVGGSYAPGSWPDLLLMVACTCLATAAVHPSMAQVTEPACPSSRRPTHARLAVLAVALLAAPTSLVLSEPGSDPVVPVAASLALSVLVFWRLAGLVLEREKVRAALHARAARQEALASIGRHALGDGDLDALFAEATGITAALLAVERCEVVAGGTPASADPRTVVLGLGDERHASAALLATGTDRWSDEDRAFLQSVANVLSGAIERHRAHELLRRRALHDPLTDLPNRATLHDRLAAALSRAAAERSTVAVLFVDLDGFKGVNDQLGHRAGDELLVAVARRLARVIRSGDLLARLAGDEFVIVCEHSDRAVAGTTAERVTSVLSQPFALSAGRARIGASVGVALGEGTVEAGVLLSEADAAMYRAKGRAGCSVAFADGELRRRADRSERLQADLGEALARQRLTVRFQPLAVVGAANEPDAPATVEALPSWEHPVEGPIGGAELRELAERGGLTTTLGEWLLLEACDALARWRARPAARAVTVVVHVGAQQLSDPALAAGVARALAGTGVPAGELCLAVTADAVDERAAAVLAELAGLGVRLAVDGLGRGLATLVEAGAVPYAVKVDLQADSRAAGRASRVLLAAAAGAAGAAGAQVLAPVGQPGAEVLPAEPAGALAFADGSRLGRQPVPAVGSAVASLPSEES